MDPLAQKYPAYSPFLYGADNPIRFFDPNGKDVKPFGEMVGVFNTLTTESPSFARKLETVNKMLGPIDVPFLSTELSKIRSRPGDEQALAITIPGLIGGNFAVEGSEVWVGNKNDIQEVSAKSQVEVVAHELEHLFKLVSGPKLLQELERIYEKVAKDFRPQEVEADEFAKKVIEEVTNTREDRRMNQLKEKWDQEKREKENEPEK